MIAIKGDFTKAEHHRKMQEIYSYMKGSLQEYCCGDMCEQAAQNSHSIRMDFRLVLAQILFLLEPLVALFALERLFKLLKEAPLTLIG
jgi:hypothetical protein